MASPQLQHLSTSQAAEVFDEIVNVYVTVYAESQTEEDFANFRARGAAQFQGAGFDLVTVRVDGDLVGFAYGLTLRAGSGWWRGLEPAPEQGFTEETGVRTFALIELAVLPEHRKKGLGRLLVDELLARRDEERATLATDPREADVQKMYERWGWRKAGRVPAASDAPVPHFDLYVLPLR
ncbi:GNAT family N-acetyltransferase [Spirillospora sp. NPDC048911]|uniref:GNAT family N-acetyltransferase n=1 Tax=Spirillospora sp. NPDC048911 TaxID=3364527 RepID=UPI00371B8222